MIKLQEYGKYVLLNGRNKGRGVVLRTLVLMSCILLGSLLHAQNNPYGIKDQLYPLYNNAYKKRTTDEGLVLAKQLYDDAVRLNDGKAQCLALSIPMLYYFYEDDKEGEFLKAVKSMQDKALATGYRQYYYFGITNTVSYFLSKNRHLEVYKYVLELEAETRSKNDMLGLFYGLTCLSQVYTAFLEFGSSNKMLEEALNVGKTYLHDQDMATVYRKMSDNYSFMFDYKRMEETAEEGLRIAKTQSTRKRLLFNAVFAEMKLGKYDEAREHCKQYIKMYNVDKNAAKMMSADKQMCVMLEILDGNYDEARRRIRNSLHMNRDSLRLEMMCSEAMYDYTSLAQQKKHFYRIWLREKDFFNTHELAKFNAALVNRKNEIENINLMLNRQLLQNQTRQAEIDNANLALANSQLSLRNSSLELGRMRTRTQMMHLQYSNKKLEADRLKIKIADQRAKHETQKVRVGLVATAMLFILVLLLWYLRFHRKVTKRLNETHAQLERNHEELVEARDRAEAANRVKTTLIQSMSCNVKESLDSITGFAMLIADNHINYTKEQKAEFYKHILKNTEQLLGVVNNVLKEAQKK